MTKSNEDLGAVEIVTPSECVVLRLQAIASIASVCEKLADALNQPVQVVNINGNITANAPNALYTGKKQKKGK
jgi:hypothetical protein